MTREQLEQLNPRALYIKCRGVGLHFPRGGIPEKGDMIEAYLNYQDELNGIRGTEDTLPEELEEMVAEHRDIIANYDTFAAKEIVNCIEDADEQLCLTILQLEFDRENGPRKTVSAALVAKGIDMPEWSEDDGMAS